MTKDDTSTLSGAIKAGDVEQTALMVRHKQALKLRRDGSMGPEEALLSVVAPSEAVLAASMQMAEELVAAGPFGRVQRGCERDGCPEIFLVEQGSTRRYCSHNCRNQAFWHRPPAEEHVPERFCERPGCGVKFTVTGRQSRKIFCSIACRASVQRTRRLKRRGIPTGERYGTRYDTCPRGHDRSEENTYVNPKTGRQQCRVCRRDDAREKIRTNEEHRIRVRDAERARRATRKDEINARRRERYAARRATARQEAAARTVASMRSASAAERTRKRGTRRGSDEG